MDIPIFRPLATASSARTTAWVKEPTIDPPLPVKRPSLPIVGLSDEVLVKTDCDSTEGTNISSCIGSNAAGCQFVSACDTGVRNAPPNAEGVGSFPDGLSLWRETLYPIYLYKRSARQKLTRSSIQHIIKAIPVRPADHFS